MYSNIFGVDISALPYDSYGIGVANVTPEMARYVLDKDYDNFRSLDKNRVSLYARSMERGDWSPALSILSFMQDGKMIDGQHRLAAVMKSETSQVFIVKVTGDREDVAKVDVGKPRSANQVLADRFKDRFKTSRDWASFFQSIVRYRRRNNLMDVQEQIANAEWLELMKSEWQNNPLEDRLNALIRERAGHLTKIPKAQMMVMDYLMCSKVGPVTADAFWDGVFRYASLNNNDPRYHLGEYLAGLNNVTFTGQQGQRKIRAVIAMTWNAWRAGKPWKRNRSRFESANFDTTHLI